MSLGGQNIFLDFISGQPVSRSPVVPIIDQVAARVGGHDYRQMTSDPALWSAALTRTADLLGCDAIPVGFDELLIVEAAGAELDWGDSTAVLAAPPEALEAVDQTVPGKARLAVAVETLGWVLAAARPEIATIGVMTGPVTLAAQCFGSEAAEGRLSDVKEAEVAITDAFLKARPDALMFLEDGALGTSPVSLKIRKIYSTLKNMAGYFDVPTMVYVSGHDNQDLSRFSALGLDVVIAGPDSAGEPASITAVEELAQAAGRVGVALPLTADGVPAMGAAVNSRLGAGRALVTSDGQLDGDADIDALRQAIEKLKA